MNNKKIVIIDLYSESFVHERVNKALVDFYSEFEETVFFSENHYRDYGVHLMKSFKVLSGPKLLRHLHRDFIVPMRLLLFAVCNWRSTERWIVIGFSNLQILILSPLIFSGLLADRVSILFHSQLEVLDYNTSRNAAKFVYYFLLRSLFKKVLNSRKIKKLVLGKHIFKNLQRFNTKSLFFAEHPIIKKDISKFNDQEIVNETDIKLGIVGLLRDDTKLCSGIYELAKANPHLQFKLVGRIGPRFTMQQLSNVEHVIFSDPVPSRVLERESNDITHICFLFGSNSYKFTASGTVVDAMIAKRGIISLRNEAVFGLAQAYPRYYELKSIHQVLDVNDLLFDDRVHLNDFMFPMMWSSNSSILATLKNFSNFDHCL